MEITAKIILFSILISISSAVDTITGNQTIRDDGNNTIQSGGGIFELGFFSPGRSTNRYLGIWYKKIPNKTVVWVANRETPLTDNSGVLRIQEQGNLGLMDGKGNIIWSTNNLSSSSVLMNLVAQLNDDGNFVLRNSTDSNSENIIWQSYDHPGDTILPGMKLGWDFVDGLNNNLTSWKSADDPSRGNYTTVVDRKGYPRVLVLNGLNLQFRFGPWDGVQFSGLYVPDPDPSFAATAIIDNKEVYFRFDLSNNSIVMRVVLNLNGKFQILRWIDPTQSWSVYLDSQRDVCDQYARCGEYGICNQSRCECLTGFEPKNPERWNVGDSSDGCVRKTQLCEKGDGFKKYSGLKFPDTRNSWFDTRVTLEDCEQRCSSNCSCTAYSNIDIRMGGTGCLLWFDNLTDIRNYVNGLDLYVKVAASDLQVAKSSSGGKSRVTITVVSVLLALAVLLALFLLVLYRKRVLRRKGMVLLNSERLNPESDATNEKEGEDLDLPLFEFITIADATNNFSENNKLGEGGFGPVYKGVLKEGQKIAVKRLSKDSRQGLDEFKNEVSCIAKLQHRNLVRLLGCCIKEKELLLIYEYMPNKSLDSIIFDKEQSKSMDWPKRYNIINGIARGLLYLHQDSRLRIIHRDLKASNILLDYEMNPRISDFGMAKTFGGNEIEANTTRVVGTFGYMSPEYAFEGIFSFKSDVYSFGVLLLEIVSGMKMRGFYNSDPNLNLLSHAWKLYKEGKFMELINRAFVESCNQSEVIRAIQIGLLCVQPYPDDRPSMLSVVLMLSSEIEVPQPKEPSFFNDKIPQESDISSSKMSSDASSSNKLTITDFAPR